VLNPGASICLVLLFVAGARSHATDWNQWRGNQRNGVAESSPALIEVLPADGLQPLWVSEPIKSAGEGGWGSPVVAGGRVYLFAHTKEKIRELGPQKYPWFAPDTRPDVTPEQYAEYERHRRDEDEERAKAFVFREFVHCFDAATGEIVWTNRSDSVYTRFPQSGSPAVVDGRVYVFGAGRVARCLDAATGDDVWKTPLPGDFRDEFLQSSIVVVDGVAVVMADHLFGIDTAGGAILWEGDSQQTRGNHSSPVLWSTGDRQCLITNLAGGWTGCFDPRDGRELWRARTESAQATPVVVGDRLITYGNSRAQGLRCFAMSDAGAEELWKYRAIQDKGSSPVVVDGHVYVQGESRLACVNLETGEEAWSDYLDLASPQFSSPIAADGKVLYAYESLLCFAAVEEGFRPLYDARFGEDGLMAAEETFRKLLNLDEVVKQPNGQEEAEKVLVRHLGRRAPLPCASPAIADGRIYLRMKHALACYDLRAARDAAASE
jgi:outer membrane protein assembly factor BamB